MADSTGVRDLVIGILGGTGDQGQGLAWRFAASGLTVLIGSRDVARAEAAAAAVRASSPSGSCQGAANDEVAHRADLVVVAVPYSGHAATLEGLREPLAGKIVVDCVNPLGFDQRGPFALQVPEGSAAQQAATILPDSRVVAAFHHVSAVLLGDPAGSHIDLDVLVLGDDRAATELVQELAAVIPGVRGVFGGRLRNAGQIEALTANLVAINRRYRAHAGIRITDVLLPSSPAPSSPAPSSPATLPRVPQLRAVPADDAVSQPRSGRQLRRAAGGGAR